jgi:L-cysteine S-thiosulfotransferase
MISRAAVLAAWATAAIWLVAVAPVAADETASSLLPGSAFLSPELQALEADSFANPGMLWVGEGERLWQEKSGAAGKSCASCHRDASASMKGVAARYPAVDARSGKLLNLELRVNSCRTQHMSANPLAYESNELLALTAYLAFQSRGEATKVNVTGAAAPYYERGKRAFFTRQGQLNLACSQCHVDFAGRRLRGDIVSHGLGVGYPVYRLEWQGLGSLHRRLRSCSFGVRAIQFGFGSDDYLTLELYLAKRAEGLAVNTPAIRK